MAQKYTPIWDDWFEVTQELNAQEKGRLIDAIIAYDNGGDWQEQIKGNERYVFPGYKSRIDRYNEICGMRISSAKQNKVKQTEAKVSKVQQNANDNDNDNDKDNDIKENPLKGVKEKRIRFSPPTVEDVSAYCKERGNNVNPERFVDFYASKGWKVGQNPMKDWKACVRTWEQRDKSPVQMPTKTVMANQYTQRPYDDAELEERLGVNDIFNVGVS